MSHRVLARLSATIAIFALALSAPSFAAPVSLAGAGYPAPGGNTATSNGVLPQNGTRSVTYGGFNPSAYDQLYYVIGDYPGPTFDPAGPALTADGGTDRLSFSSGASNLAGGVAIWQGTTNIPRSGTSSLLVDTRFVLSVTDLASVPLSLTSAGSIDGMPTSVGAALLVPSTGFTATWLFQMANAGTNNWTTATSFYNSIAQRDPAYSLQSSVGGAFYASPVPLPAGAWLLLSGLGGAGIGLRRRRPRKVAS